MNSEIHTGTKNHIDLNYWQPCANDDWSKTIAASPQANLAHAAEWFTIIKEAYGHSPIYLSANDSNGNFAVLPSFCLRRPFIGRVVSSMPFLDYGGPCSSSARFEKILIDRLIEIGKQHKAKFVEVRCLKPLDLPVPALLEKVNLVIPLPETPEELWHRLNGKVRYGIRKAVRLGLSVEFGGLEKLESFYKIFAVNMRDLGSPVHNLRFFRAVFAAFDEKVRIALVYQGDKPIGGLIALAFKDSLAVPWASSMRKYFSLNPNMILFWETLRMACTEGFRKFDFGRANRDSGAHRFKNNWGAVEQQLYWYTIPIGENHIRRFSNTGAQGQRMAKFWSFLPINLTLWLGPKIRKYITL